MTTDMTPEMTEEHTTGQRAMYFRILMTILIGMFIALVIIRIFAASMGGSPENIMGRVYQARATLPEIASEAREKDTLMFFGSSMVEAGFSPREFEQMLDEKDVNIRAWNFGFGGLNPLYQDYLARRIRDSFMENDARLKVAFIEFNPFQTTITRRDGARASDDSYINMLASDAEIFEIMKQDVRRGIRMFNIRYLRNNVSAEMATSFFGGFLRPRAPRSEIELDEETETRLDEIGELLNKAFEEEFPDFEPCRWCKDLQGFRSIAGDRKPETVELFREYYELREHPYFKENALLRRIHSADIIDLNFDEELIVHFIRLVKVFQEFSDDVQVVLLPRNSDWVVYPPEAEARLNAVIERIERETGLTLHNHQLIEEVPNNLYSDTTHLTGYFGAVAYTQYLADRYADRIREAVSQ